MKICFVFHDPELCFFKYRTIWGRTRQIAIFLRGYKCVFALDRGKKVLKEKIVQLYEGFFRGEQLTLGNANFWQEFFLIKPKMAALEAEIGALQVIFLSAFDQRCGIRSDPELLRPERSRSDTLGVQKCPVNIVFKSPLSGCLRNV